MLHQEQQGVSRVEFGYTVHNIEMDGKFFCNDDHLNLNVAQHYNVITLLLLHIRLCIFIYKYIFS
jgi:hypothetical protein